MESVNRSEKADDRILKVARTIADLKGASEVLGNNISEEIRYRSLDRDGGLG